ncbi:MAG: aminotransferase class I/II-fold pyridoxal phosphate-dependent enzyme [Legionellales bacterium]
MKSQILNNEESEESRHLENFNVSDFLQMKFDSLDEKADAFSYNFQESCIKTGFLMREICGNIGKNTLVRNPRTGKEETLLMLGSNNYLDLAQEPYIINKAIAAVKHFGIGCGGPQLLNGNTSLHIELQNKIASIKGAEAAILFSSGYSANVGWPRALLGKDDWLIYDVQSHGSLYDSMKTKQFNSMFFPHNDTMALQKRLKKIRSTHPRSTIIVCVEGVYSMDGDIAPLGDLRKVCDDYHALLCIDDAHGSGVLGDHGHGTQEHFGLTGKIDLYMGTFSKVYCVTGGYVAGKKHLMDFLRINARSNLFSASLPPYSVAAVLAAIEFIEQNPQRVKMLHHNARYMAQKLCDAGFNAYTESGIIPIFIEQPHSVKEIVAELHDEGVFINGIEYPSVPKNKQRIRLSMMATFKQHELDYAIDKMVKMAMRRGIIPSP